MTAAPASISRRAFLKLAPLSLGALALHRLAIASAAALPGFPQAGRLGRVLESHVALKLRPDIDSPDVGTLYADDIVVWLRELVGKRPLWNTQRFVETPDGYLYAPNLQPVYNQPNQPLAQLPNAEGIWAEVSVPYADLVLANPPARSPWLGYTTTPRLYYSQVMWVDQLKTDEQGQVWYRVSDRYGGFGDFFWVAAEAMRPLSEADTAPINPAAADKLVVVDVTYQTLSCLEGGSEVRFCRVSTGPKIESAQKPNGEWATPPGKHTIWRKLVSVHMTGGTTGGGYDLPGIGWTTLFAAKGMAIHSTFWHNGFGTPLSHGCVNANPDDANWIFRWTLPQVPLDIGDVTVNGLESTRVLVKEG